MIASRSFALLLFVAVIVVTAGCGKKKASTETAGSAAGSGSAAAATTATIVGEWNVYEHNGACFASKHEGCPPDVACDPPPPSAIECPAGSKDGNVRIVELSNKTCATAPADCQTAACLGAATACPLPQGAVMPTLAWAVTPMVDGSCRASFSTPGAGTKYVTIKCPAAPSTFIRRADRDAPCIAEQDGKPTGEVPCPVEPAQYTVAALREAFVKDQASVEEQRVRIQGYSVFAMGGSTISGKVTTYSVGAADSADDAKIAIKCFSKTKPPELAGGDPVIVEGVVRGSAPEKLILAECTAALP